MKIKLNTKLKIVNQKNLRINYFLMLFPIGNLEYKDIYNVRLLTSLMSSYSCKYPEEDSFEYALDEHMVAGYSVGLMEVGETNYLKVKFSIPEEGIFDDFDVKESLEFVKEILFNSICIDDKNLTDKKYLLDYYRLKENIERRSSSFEGFISNEWAKQIDGNRDFILSINDSLDFLENSTSKDRIIEIYNKYILNNDFITFVNGHVEDEEKLTSIFNDVFNIKEKEFDFETDYEHLYNLSCKGENVIHNDEYNQSYVRMQFHKKNYEYKEVYYLMALNLMIKRPENNLLFKKLRSEYNLVYKCNSLCRKNVGVVELYANLSKDNIDLCKKGMLEVIDSLRDKEFFEECQKNMLKADQIHLYSLLDSKYNELDNTADKTLNIPLFTEEYEELKNINHEDFVKFLDELENTNTIVVVGDKND